MQRNWIGKSVGAELTFALAEPAPTLPASRFSPPGRIRFLAPPS
jgi:hypothetical protein